VPEVGRRTVCISQSDGAGGEDVGRLAAEHLGFLYVDDEIVAEAASRGGISAADVADEERRKSAVARILEEIGRNIAIDGTGLVHAPVEGGAAPDLARDLIKEAIDAVASRGDAVIASHGASFALTGRQDVLRVLVTASPETRVRRVQEARGLAPEECQKEVREGDAARRDYLRRFYSVRSELPTHYDLVVNTDTFTVEQAADLVVQAAGRGA
jgi:cytidylate kinase